MLQVRPEKARARAYAGVVLTFFFSVPSGANCSFAHSVQELKVRDVQLLKEPLPEKQAAAADRAFCDVCGLSTSGTSHYHKRAACSRYFSMN